MGETPSMPPEIVCDALPKLTALPTLKPERRKGLSKRLAADKVECRWRLPFWHFSYALEGATVRIPRVIHRWKTLYALAARLNHGQGFGKNSL